MGTVYISNDINYPCNIKKCTSEAIESCYGCLDWFIWNYNIDQSDKCNPKQAYVGKHYGEGKDMRDFNTVKSDLIRKLSLSCQKTDGEILWYEGTLDVLIEFLSILFFIPKWIPVTERLPPAEKEVYVTDGEYIARANLLDKVFPGDKPCWSYSGLGEITHWCEQIPLPPLPKERILPHWKVCGSNQPISKDKVFCCPNPVCNKGKLLESQLTNYCPHCGLRLYKPEPLKEK